MIHLTRPGLTFLLLSISLIHSYGQALPEQWKHTFKARGMATDRIYAIHADASGHVYMAGYAGHQRGAPDAFVMKRSPAGDTLWTYYYDSGAQDEDYATAIAVDLLGNTYITGHSKNASYRFDCFTAKILPNGTQAWMNRYQAGGNSQSYGNALAVDAAGNVYVVGYIDPASGSDDWLVIKYNAAGTEQWVDILNGPANGNDQAQTIAIAPNGNPTVGGFVTATAANGGINAFVKQYTPANGIAWTDTWTNPGTTGTDQILGLGFLSNGDLLVGGITKNGANNDAFAMRYNTSGIRQWVTIYSDATTTNDEYLRQVVVNPLGHIYFGGTDYQDAYVTCIHADGTQAWRKKWKGPVTGGQDVFHGITVDDAGNLYATGRGVYPGPSYYGNGGLPNMIITKYSPQGDSLWTYRTQHSLSSSMGFAITHVAGKIYAGGFVTDTAWINENLLTIVLDTSGNPITEWIYNGQGEAITTSQIVVTDSAYNVYVGATVDRLYNEGTDIVLIKYDHAGNLEWERYYSSPGLHNDTLTAMQLDPQGDLVLCLSADVNKLKNNYRLSLLKVGQDGSFLDTTWYASPGSVIASDMAIDSLGNIAVSAHASTLGGLIVYFDTTFSPAWAARIDSAAGTLSRAHSIAFFPGGDIAVGGYASLSGVIAGKVQRFSNQGNRLWNTQIDSLNVWDEVRGIDISHSGDIAYTGRTATKAMVGKLDGTNGSPVWHQVYDPPSSSEYGLKVRFTPNGSIAFICRGWTGSVARYYTAQYSATGAFQWGNVYSQTPSDREPLHILVESTGRVVTAGYAISGSTINYDYVLVGYEATGSVSFINTYNTVNPLSAASWDQLRGMTRDGFGNFIVTGQVATEFHNTWLFRTLTIKYGNFYVGEDAVRPMPSVSVKAYPNPSPDGHFSLLDASPYRMVELLVHDMQGRRVYVRQGQQDSIFLPGQQPGIYLLSIKRENGHSERIKLMLR